MERFPLTVYEDISDVSVTNYNDHAIAFSDTGDCKVKVINPATKECFVLVGDGQGTRDGSKAQLSQPTGICFDMKTLFTVDTSTGVFRMTSNVNSLVEYLKYLHLSERHLDSFFSPLKGSSSRHRDDASNRETRVSLSI